MTTIISMISMLFFVNAIAHVISFLQFKKSEEENAKTNAIGVLAFAIINFALAVLIGLNIALATSFAFIIPLIGGLGLFVTTILPKKGRAIDYLILLLDIATLGCLFAV